MTTLAPGVLIFEKRPRWEAELKRRLMPEGIRVRACRTVAAISLALAEMPDSVIVLELEAGPAICLQLLGKMMEAHWQAQPVVIGAPTTAELEWPARELGAVDFVFNTVRADELARLCRRLVAHVTTASAEPLWATLLSQ